MPFCWLHMDTVVSSMAGVRFPLMLCVVAVYVLHTACMFEMHPHTFLLTLRQAEYSLLMAGRTLPLYVS